MTPFHNMALIAPDTSISDVDYHTLVFREAVQSLLTGKTGAVNGR
jgi:hypothetical protein